MKLVIIIFTILCTSSFAPYLSRQETIAQLREDYVSSLKHYEGEAYGLYGDDSGISCSTLIRRAFVNTTEIDGTTRSIVEHYPCDSDELEHGCEGQLSFVLKAANLKSLDYEQLKPGDIAIVGNEVGVHSMAYVGNETWIHADPIKEKVVEFEESTENDDWMTFHVRVMRWNALKGS